MQHRTQAAQFNAGTPQQRSRLGIAQLRRFGHSQGQAPHLAPIAAVDELPGAGPIRASELRKQAARHGALHPLTGPLVFTSPNGGQGLFGDPVTPALIAQHKASPTSTVPHAILINEGRDGARAGIHEVACTRFMGRAKRNVHVAVALHASVGSAQALGQKARQGLCRCGQRFAHAGHTGIHTRHRPAGQLLGHVLGQVMQGLGQLHSAGLGGQAHATEAAHLRLRQHLPLRVHRGPATRGAPGIQPQVDHTLMNHWRWAIQAATA